MHRHGDVADVSYHYQQNSAGIYRQYLLIKAAALLFCTECSETQVATSSVIGWRKFFVLFLTAGSPPTTSSSA